MSDFLDIITRGLNVATTAMGESFTVSGTTYSGVFSSIDTSVDYESMSGYDTEDSCNLSISKDELSTPISNNTEITRADSSVWIVVESSTADQNNYDYSLKKKES